MPRGAGAGEPPTPTWLFPRGIRGRPPVAATAEGVGGTEAALARSDWAMGDYSSHEPTHVSEFPCEEEGEWMHHGCAFPSFPSSGPDFFRSF